MRVHRLCMLTVLLLPDVSSRLDQYPESRTTRLLYPVTGDNNDIVLLLVVLITATELIWPHTTRRLCYNGTLTTARPTFVIIGDNNHRALLLSIVV